MGEIHVIERHTATLSSGIEITIEDIGDQGYARIAIGGEYALIPKNLLHDLFLSWWSGDDAPDIRGKCCQCGNALENGGHQACQKSTGAALRRMRMALDNIKAEAFSTDGDWESVRQEVKNGLGI